MVKNKKIIVCTLMLFLVVVMSYSTLATGAYPHTTNPYGATRVFHLENNTETTMIDFLGIENGILVNTETTDWGPVKFGNGTTLDGTNEIGNTNWGNGWRVNGNLTICWWMNLTSGGDVNDYLLGMTDGTEYLDAYISVQDNNLYFRIKDGATTRYTEYNNPLMGGNQNRHYCFQIVNEPGLRMFLYVDGKNFTAVTGSSGMGALQNDVAIASDFWINDRGTAAGPYGAKWDDVLIFDNITLSASDILTINNSNYSAGAPAPPTPSATINVSVPNPAEGATFNYPFLYTGANISFNLTANSSSVFSCSLLINGTINKTINNYPGSAPLPEDVEFNITGFLKGHYNYNISCTNTDNTTSTGKYNFKVEDYPYGNTLNVSNAFPADLTQYNINTISLNTTVNSSISFDCALYINNSLNFTITGFPASTAGNPTPVEFNITFEDEAFRFNISCTNTINRSVTPENTFYIDITSPIITTGFLNNSFYYKHNITAQFNFSDNVILSSFNLTIDGLQIYSVGNINTSTYTYNLNYDPSALGPGYKNFTVTLADGHTDNILKGDYDVSNGLFNDYIKYEFYDDGYVKTYSKAQSIFDDWSSQKKIDRYTQTFIPNVPSSTITLVEESDLPIQIVNKKGSYNDKWIIIGNHWKDYVLENEDSITVDINKITDYKVEVTISGIKNPEKLQFSSIGDLNIITRSYNISVLGNATVSYSSIVSELESQTVIFYLNKSTFVTSTHASFYYNGSNMSYTKTSFTNYDIYSSTFLTPKVENTVNDTRIISWKYEYIGAENYSGYINNSQYIYIMGIDNCSTYMMRAINFSMKDDTTNQNINGTIRGYFKVWVDAMANYTNHNLSWYINDDNTPVGLCIFPNSSSYVSYAQMEYFDAYGVYDLKTYYFENVSLDNITENVILYLTNQTTTQVQFTVKDFNDVPVEDVIIKVLKYSIATDSYKVTEIVKTDDNGQAYGQLRLYDTWYKFILEKDGIVYLETEAAYIIATTKTFRINLDEPTYFQNYDVVRSMSGYITYTNATKTFSFTFSDSTNNVQKGCIRVYRNTINKQTKLYDQCVNSAAGVLTYTITEDTAKNTYRGLGYVIIEGNEYVIDEVSVSYNSDYKTLGLNGVFMGFLLTLTLVMVGIWHPVAGVTLMLVGLTVSIIIGSFQVTWGVLIGIIIMGGIALYKLGRS